jgi:hypothetical protein
VEMLAICEAALEIAWDAEAAYGGVGQ